MNKTLGTFIKPLKRVTVEEMTRERRDLLHYNHDGLGFGHHTNPLFNLIHVTLQSFCLLVEISVSFQQRLQKRKIRICQIIDEGLSIPTKFPS